jgi:2Fe-2S ferredoxin
MTLNLLVVDRDGDEHEIQAPVGGSLMEALRELEYGVAAICGGVRSCGTCHVYIAPEWLVRLPCLQNDERELLGELQNSSEFSRLSCQIHLKGELDGLRIALAPEE